MVKHSWPKGYDQNYWQNLFDLCKQLNRSLDRAVSGNYDDEPSSLSFLPSFVTDTLHFEAIKRSNADDRSFPLNEVKILSVDFCSASLKITLLKVQGNPLRVHSELGNWEFFFDMEKREEFEGEKLLDILVGFCYDFLQKEEIKMHIFSQKVYITLSFPFAYEQTSISAAYMRYSSKSFSLDSLRGKEIVETLNEKFKQFKPQGVPVLEVVALVNDAVSSLAGFKFLHESCDLAFRINVGVNGSYFEYSRVIDYLKRCDYRIEELTERMAINLELGGYGNPKFSSDYSFLKKFEIKYDDMSNPQKDGNRFERMTGGMYIVELLRLYIEDNYNELDESWIIQPNSLKITELSEFLELFQSLQVDSEKDLQNLFKRSQNKLINLLSLLDKNQSQDLYKFSTFIVDRSASLLAASIFSVGWRVFSAKNQVVKVGLAGELIENNYCNYKERLKHFLPPIVDHFVKFTPKPIFEFLIMQNSSTIGSCLINCAEFIRRIESKIEINLLKG